MAKDGNKLTPLMRQYFELKDKYKDAILLYRVGDFYETFDEDAKLVAEILGIVLTSRNNGGSKLPLAGFPYHSLDTYLPRLVKAGYRVALCEQLEKPSKQKKVVKRGVTEILTPGLHNREDVLERKEANYLCAFSASAKDDLCAIALIDYSTGEFITYQGDQQSTTNLVNNYKPKEILLGTNQELPIELMHLQHLTYPLDDWLFDTDYCRDKILGFFELQSLKGFGIDKMPYAIQTCGVILHYLDATHNGNVHHIRGISRIAAEEFLWLDTFTIRNLELLQPLHGNGQSLIDVIDRTVSPMGARLLRQWVTFPLIDPTAIEERLDQIEALISDEELKDFITDELRALGDLARLTTKIAARKLPPRGVITLLSGLFVVHKIKDQLLANEHPHIQHLGHQLERCDELATRIQSTFVEEPPAVIGKSPLIRTGYHAELDEWTALMSNSKDILLEIQQREADRTGIDKLKIGFNNVFGYYLEVSARYKHSDLIPEDWIRKQTLTNSERYITPELKEIEDKILRAEGEVLRIEQALYDAFIDEAQAYIASLQKNAHWLGYVDIITGLAQLAVAQNYTRPEFNDRGVIHIADGRHPVIEATMPPGEPFIPNSVRLDKADQQIILITGPNMSGKSAVLRQTAIICLMAQIGSYVPAQAADLYCLDRLFTRVGASDNISSGESTFMVEMNETANILNNLSPNSLILLDEIGRGTSTFDGISIAWSIVEYLHEHSPFRPFTLFATHYHELNELGKKYDRISNYHVATQKAGNKIIFLRKLTPGSVEHSFGIYVAKMAGFPDLITQRALTILEQMEAQKISTTPVAEGETLQGPAVQPIQMSIFDMTDPNYHEIVSRLDAIDINAMTPVESLLKLKELLDIHKRRG